MINEENPHWIVIIIAADCNNVSFITNDNKKNFMILQQMFKIPHEKTDLEICFKYPLSGSNTY